MLCCGLSSWLCRSVMRLMAWWITVLQWQIIRKFRAVTILVLSSTHTGGFILFLLFLPTQGKGQVSKRSSWLIWIIIILCSTCLGINNGCHHPFTWNTDTDFIILIHERKQSLKLCFYSQNYSLNFKNLDIEMFFCNFSLELFGQ